MKIEVKNELGNYKSEIVDSVVGDGDLNWLDGRPLESILEDVRSEFASIVGDIKNINTGDLENEIREDCENEAETEALETLGVADAESVTPADETFFNQLKDRIMERLVKEKLPEYVRREVEQLI